MKKNIVRLAPQQQVKRIPLKNIKESIVTLRTEYDKEALAELGASIVEQGQLQTIVVQLNRKGHYDLIIGSRRFRAAKQRKLRDIAAYVIEKKSPVQAMFVALAENLHRTDLDPFEEAQAFLRLTKEYGLNLKAVARGVNKPEQYVRGRLQLLSMPEKVITLISQGKLSLNHVRPLARLSSGEDQVRLAESSVSNRLTVAELSNIVMGEREEPPRVEREKHELTIVKVGARVSGFTLFLQKVPRRINLAHINAVEKESILEVLDSQAKELQMLRNIIEKVETSRSTARSRKTTNQSEEWTTKDLQRIVSDQRPTDEELAVELGRSVSAIKSMRSKVRKTA